MILVSKQLQLRSYLRLYRRNKLNLFELPPKVCPEKRQKENVNKTQSIKVTLIGPN